MEIFWQSLSLRDWSLFATHCPKCHARLVNKAALFWTLLAGFLIGALAETSLMIVSFYKTGDLIIPFGYQLLVVVAAVVVVLLIYSQLFGSIGTIETQKR